MKPRLRGHHLICLHFFKGEGYSEDFINNIYSVLENKEMEVTEGADDICAKCPYLEDNRCASNKYTDEDIRSQDEVALKLLGVEPGMILEWESIAVRLPLALDDWKSRFCVDCGYRKICFN